MSFSLLLTDLDELRPVVSGADIESAHRRQPPRPEPPMPDDLYSSGQLDDIGIQRWGLIAPKGADGDRMLAAVASLRDWRKREQNSEVLTLRVPAGMTVDGERAFKHQTWARLAQRIRPRYLLILGDLHEVSLAVQQSFMASACVGRLCFTTPDGAVDTAAYEAYCHKVIAAERAAPDRASPRLLFQATRDLDDDALENHYAYVVKQCRQHATANGDVPAGDILGFGRPGDPQWDSGRPGQSGAELARQISASDESTLLHWAKQQHPSVLLSLCHGAGVRDPARQRLEQGALILSGRHGTRVLDHSYFLERSFLPGGFWMLNACFGAGTPARSVYHPWLEKLAALSGERVTPALALKFLAGASPPAKAVMRGVSPTASASGQPFIARLPQAALANPRGPLGFLGHVDIVWGYGYQSAMAGGAADSSPYYGIIQALAQGDRFGVALRSFTEQAAALGLELAFMDPGPEPEKQLQRTRMWLQCWDLYGYILLGDPAARLPVRGAEPQTPGATAATVQPAQEPGSQPERDGQEAPASMSPERMQEAVFRCIRGEDPSAVAAEHGVSRDVLMRWRTAYTIAGMAALQIVKLTEDG